MTEGRVLLFGIGNPGRHDDGLGPALAARIEALGIEGLDVDADYQLTVEDSAAAAEHAVVIFADADATEGEAPFTFRPIGPVPGAGFSSHGIEPGHVLSLAGELFGRCPEAYLLGIRGVEFGQLGPGRIELGEGLSETARANLEAAVAFLVPVLRTRSFRAAAGS